MKLIVGLGNPGEKYAGQRHNVGFMAVDAIAGEGGLGPFRKRFQALVAEGETGGVRFLLMKPQTFMNESGRSVGEALRFYKLAAADVVVLHDELDIAPGRVKVKSGGGSAGHNGLKSISGHIGNDYTRLRIGIGHPGDREAVSGYVLHDFARSDRDWLEPLLAAIPRGLPALLSGDEARFMNEMQRLSRGMPRQAPPAAVASGRAGTASPELVAAVSVAAPAATVAPARIAEPSARDAQPAAAREAGDTSLGAKLAGWFGKRR